MNDMTISEVSRRYGVSTRMLRYYEKEGLITCRRRPGYAYRTYDETAVKRLQQILLLRKLRLSLKQIGILLSSAAKAAEMTAILRQKRSEMEDEINALKTIHDILSRITIPTSQNPMELLEAEAIQPAINAIPLSQTLLKEKPSHVEKADNVRLLMLPPFTAAAYYYIGEEPEEKVGAVMSEFIQSSHLYEIKPDARLFGLSHPSPAEPENVYGYENWVTIPEDWEVAAPFTKKHFQGGLYAAMTIDFPEFYRWQSLEAWVLSSSLYEPCWGNETMKGCLEEHLNWVYAAHMGWPENGIDGKVDLMLPIKRKGEHKENERE